jgi:hypothetical protein
MQIIKILPYWRVDIRIICLTADHLQTANLIMIESDIENKDQSISFWMDIDSTSIYK